MVPQPSISPRLAFVFRLCELREPMGGNGLTSGVKRTWDASGSMGPVGRRGLLLAGALWLAPQAALAQAKPEEIAVARQLFHEANALREELRWGEAADKLREAILIKETPGLRYHLAYCLEQQGKLLAAQQDYERAADMIQAGVRAPDVKELLEQARSRLAVTTPRLKVRVTPADSVPQIRVNGAEFRADEFVTLDPGTYEVSASAPGYVSSVLVLTLAQRDRRVAKFDLVARPSDPALASSAARQSSSHLVALVVGSSVTAVAAATGTGFLIAANDAGSAADQARAELVAGAPGAGGDNPCAAPANASVEQLCAELTNSQNKQRSFEGAAIGFFIGAGVAATTTAVLTWSLWPESPLTTTTLRPAVGPGFFGGSAAVRF